MIGSLAAVPLPDATEPPQPPLLLDPLQDELLSAHRIEVPVVLFPWPRRLIRVSAHLYNAEAEYERLAGVLRDAV